MSDETVMTGGCQCGAVRFRVMGEALDVSLCHCRMCQKATGGPFSVAVGVRRDDLSWTRGAPAEFASSNLARRGFCAACGTTLSYGFEGDGTVALSIGAFDDPRRFPRIDFALAGEERLPSIRAIESLPEQEIAATPELKARFDAISNYQHPDHDTETWPQLQDEK